MLYDDMAVKKMAHRTMKKGRTATDVKKGLNGFVMIRKLASSFLLFVVATCTLTGCIRSKLSLLERIMESDVQVADSIIYSINEPNGKQNHALYSLLKTQIDYKMYRDIPNDSLIRIATEYFGTNTKGYHAAMSWYSLGCVAGLAGKDSVAVDAYLKAMSLFPDTLVRYYTLCEQNLGRIYVDHKMDAEAIRMLNSCRTNAVRLNDSAAIAFCDYNTATLYLYQMEYDTAQKMFLELKDSKWLSDNTKDLPLLQLSKILLLRDKNYDGAISYADSFISKNRNTLSYGAVYDIKANSYYYLNQLDSALSYYNLAITNSSDPHTVCDSYRRLAEIYAITGKTDSSYYCTVQASAWIDTIASITNPNDLFRMLNKQSEADTLIFQKRNSLNSNMLFLASIIIIVLVALIVLHNKSEQAVIPTSTPAQENNVAKEHEPDEMTTYSTNIQHKPSTISDFQDEINTFKQTDLYKRMVDVTHKQEELISKERNEITDNFSTSLNGLSLFLKSSSSNLNNIDICFCLFIILGFKQKDFNLFFNISPSGYRNLKLRLRNKLTQSIYDSIFAP